MPRKIFLYLTFLFSALTQAVCSVPSIQHIGERDGLPNRRVYELKTDKNGFVWIYTLSGIARFDGKEMRNYQLKDIDLSRDYVQSATTMGLTPEGNLWVGIKTGQVFAYNNDFDRFDKIFDLAEKGLPDIRLYNLMYNNNEMVLCTSDGIYVALPDSIFRKALEHTPVYSIAAASPTEWYAASDNGIYKIAPSGNNNTTAHLIPGSEHGKFRNLTISSGKLFAGSFAEGLFCLDLSTGKFNRILPEIPIVPVNSLTTANDSTLFAGLDGGGVYIIDTKTLRLRNIINSSASNGGLSANTVSGVCQDRDGGIWISTSTQGINYLPPGNGKGMPDIHNGTNSIPSDYVMSVFEDRDGDIWYGTDNGLSMKSRDGSWRHYLTQSHLADMNILSITQSNDGLIWAGGYGSGLWMIDKKTGSTRRIPAYNGDSGAGTEYIFTVFADGNNIWFGGIEGPLTRYNRSTETYTYYPTECAGDILRAPDGSLIFTGCEGIGTLRPGSDSIVWTAQAGNLSLSHPTRFVVRTKTTGELWFATDGEGIVIMNPSTGQASHLPTPDIANSESIDGIAVDSKGRIWFCTESELFYVCPSTGRIVNMTGAISQNNELQITSGTLTALSNGNIILGTACGAITLDADTETLHGAAPKIIFTDLSVNHERVIPGGDILKKSLDNTEAITLHHYNNDLAIAFSAIDFSGGRHIQYKWMLEGRDDEWWDAGKTKIAEYRNLPPGKYRFVVKAIDSLSDSTVDERSFNIRILPPIWLTWWAIMIYIIAAIAAIAIAIKYLRRRQRERRIADKLESFLSIVHDLRTPLTLIKAPLSEVESQTDLPSQTKQNVGIAMSNVEKLLGMVGRLLDLRRESNHSDSLNISEVSLHDYLEAKAAEYRVAALQKKLTLAVDAPESLPPVKMDCNKISHVLDNLINNAIKYTFSGGITIKASCDKNTWSISISDTGIGIPRRDRRNLFVRQFRGANAIATEELGSGMGHLIVHRLCKLHKGSVKVTSEENHGTTFVLTFPMNVSSSVRRLPDIPATESEPEETTTDNNRDTVVLIDDDNEMLSYLTRSMSASYNTFAFSNAADALERIPDLNPDIVISDVRLQGMSGFELCQTLKNSFDTSHIPVILLSGLSERQNIILGLESGANDYIVKPFDISVLRLRVRNILNSRKEMRSRVLDSSETDTDKEELINELDREFLDKFNKVLDEHLQDSMYAIADLCRDLAMSRTTVYNKIKALTGVSINEFIRLRRLNKAKEMLASRRYTVADVAYMTGFSDPKYFSTCFKKQFGISPSKV